MNYLDHVLSYKGINLGHKKRIAIEEFATSKYSEGKDFVMVTCLEKFPQHLSSLAHAPTPKNKKSLNMGCKNNKRVS